MGSHIFAWISLNTIISQCRSSEVLQEPFPYSFQTASPIFAYTVACNSKLISFPATVAFTPILFYSLTCQMSDQINIHHRKVCCKSQFADWIANWAAHKRIYMYGITLAHWDAGVVLEILTGTNMFLQQLEGKGGFVIFPQILFVFLFNNKITN